MFANVWSEEFNMQSKNKENWVLYVPPENATYAHSIMY